MNGYLSQLMIFLTCSLIVFFNGTVVIKYICTDLKCQLVTSCIVHLADSANIKSVTSNRLCNGLTGLCFESLNDSINVTVTAKLKETRYT
jgi:hypothetical protein